jgi:hypothetical protein
MSEPIPSPSPEPEPTSIPEPAASLPAPAPGPSTWGSLVDSLPAALRDNPLIGAYGEGDTPKGFAGLVKDHVELQKMVGVGGEKVTLPTDKSTPEEWDAFYARTGRPETAEEYDFGDFTPPDNVEWDGELMTQIVEGLHSRVGLSNRQMNDAMRVYAEVYGENAEARKLENSQKMVESETFLKKKYGLEYDAKKELAQRLWTHMFGDNAQAVADSPFGDGTLAGTHPVIIEGMILAAEAMDEAKFVGNVEGSGGTGFSPAAAQEQIDAMERNPDISKILTDPRHHDYAATRRKYDALYVAANTDS